MSSTPEAPEAPGAPGPAVDAAGSARVTAPGGGRSPRRRDRARSGVPERDDGSAGRDSSAGPVPGDAGSAARTGGRSSPRAGAAPAGDGVTAGSAVVAEASSTAPGAPPAGSRGAFSRR
ncbi:hypothetical protein [Pseudonocardia alni]|uniref:hypothetical protein n=1 Tax=Pseudonocardia alni TaxID=33907 RepID=UPI0033F61D4F